MSKLREMVSPEMIADLESKMPPEEVDKLLLSVAQTMLRKVEEKMSENPSQKEEKDPGAEPQPMN